MKKIIAILLLICTFTLCLASCDGGKEGEEMSPDAISDVRKTLDTMALTVDADVVVLSNDIQLYEFAVLMKNEYDIKKNYEDSCDSFDELMGQIKETIDYCDENSGCFSEETRASIDVLETIYNEILTKSKEYNKSLHQEKYVAVMKELKTKVSAWNYIATVE